MREIWIIEDKETKELHLYSSKEKAESWAKGMARISAVYENRFKIIKQVLG